MKVKFDLSFGSKERFFDRQVIEQSLEPAYHSYLYKSGAFVRKVAIRSLRRGNKKKRTPSAPGTPPKHYMPGSSEGLRRIFYTLSNNNMQVDIGPVKYERTKGIPVPRLHEYGGRQHNTVYRLSPRDGRTKWMFEQKNRDKYPGLARAIDKFTSYGRKVEPKFRYGQKRPVMAEDFNLEEDHTRLAGVYPPRPFMQPALDKPETQTKLNQLWQETIRNTLKKGIKWGPK